MSDIDLQYTHIRGTDKKVADILSRWQGTREQIYWLYSHVQQPIWLKVSLDMLDLDPKKYCVLVICVCLQGSAKIDIMILRDATLCVLDKL